MNSQEIDDKVFGTTSLNPIHCPHESCNKLIRFKNLRSVDYVVTEKTNIVAVFCQSCEMRPGGKMHLCLSCGRYRVGSLSNLTKRCKCPPLTTSTERSRDSDDIPDEEHQEQQGEEQSDFNVGFDAGHVQDIDNPSEEDHQEQQGKEQSDFNVGFDAGHEQDENNVGNAQLFGNDGNEDYDNIVSSDDDIDSSDDDEDEDDDEKATGPNHNHVNFDDMPEDDFDEAAADDDADVGYGGDNTGDMAMLNTEWFDADAFFSTQNNWPRNSSTYFIAEHKDGTGRENIVKNVLFDRNTALGMRNDRISKDEMHDIFHQASTYYNVTSSDRADFCSMVDNVRVGAEVKLKKVNMDWEDAIREASKQCKIEWTEDVNVDKFIEIVKRARYTQTAEREVNDLHIQPIRDAKDVRQKLVEGPKSVIKLLPIPQVSVQSVLDPAVGGKERQFAHIDADQLINHALAYRDNKINYYRAGYEEDWDPDSDLYRNDHLRRKFLGSKKCKEIHDFVKRLVQEGQITKEARIVFMRSWSDAFGAHAITANNEYNSIQVFTIRFKGETDFILPHALLFKKWNSKDMIIELLSEIKELETAKTRYWSSDRKAVETLVFTELVSNDLPERTYNLHFSNNGTYSKWYGHSCLFNACTTPSCENCWRARVDIILGENQTMPVCNECHDWWSTNVLQADIKYPLDPGYSILTMEEQDTPVVSLTLSAMCTSLHELAEWYGKEIIKDREPTIVKDVVQKYVRLICLAEPAKMAEMIFEEYKDIAMSNSYPSMFKEFPRLEVEIALFPSVVMHMFFLGVAKSLIKQSNRLKVVGNQRRDVKAWWKSFHSRILSQQKLIKGLSLSWCYPMSFSATDGNADGDDNETTKKGSKQGQFFTTGWMSSHYVDFTRISLFQYSSLDKKLCEAPAGFEKVIPVFRRLFVLWFCLCANAFAPPMETSSARVDHLVRLFLSCCVEYHRVAKQMKPNKKTGEAKMPFYCTASNFFSLLNCKGLIDEFGSLRYLWEGLDEHFIQLLKREIKTLRHSTQSLKNLLDKMLRTMVLKNLTSDNPHVYRNPYTRTSEFKTYSRGGDIQSPQDVLKCQFISGVVIDNEFYITFRASERAYQVHKLKFSDDVGDWYLNLWYSKVEIEGPSIEFIDLTAKSKIQELSQDQFLLLRQGNNHDFGTIICHSWKVRMSDGSLQLPMPRKDILISEEE